MQTNQLFDLRCSFEEKKQTRRKDTVTIDDRMSKGFNDERVMLMIIFWIGLNPSRIFFLSCDGIKRMNMTLVYQNPCSSTFIEVIFQEPKRTFFEFHENLQLYENA